jgi:hypothetical protein
MHKLREGLLRAHNVGFLSGVQSSERLETNVQDAPSACQMPVECAQSFQ